jgi:radical SAM superfamily enzyme YgiQ (UPF0313 family)
MEFCEGMIKSGLNKKIRWITETKVDLVNRQLLERMKESGLYLIMYGFETGSQRILEMINKHTTLDKARLVMQDTQKSGIRSLGLFMLGFPGETVAEAKKTISFAQSLGCDLVKFNLLTPYPGSGLYNSYVKDKLLAYKNPELFSSWYMISNKNNNSFNFSNMTTSQLLNIQRLALLSYYLRPSIIYNTFVKRIIRFDAAIKAVVFLFINFFLMAKRADKNIPESNQEELDL